MTKKDNSIIGPPSTQAPGKATVERPGAHGPLSGTTGSGPKKPPTPGK